MESLVTVGIPTHNRPEGLKRTLDIITRQSYSNLHIIVSDNASIEADLVYSIVSSYMEEDDRIEFYRQPKNLGPIANMQFLLDKRRGDFFMFASDDDWWSVYYIEEILKGMEFEPTAAIGFCNYQVVDEKGNLLDRTYPSNYIPFLRKFTDKNIDKRITSYIMQNEINGKQNIFYGIVREEHIAGLNLVDFVSEHGFYGADGLYVFLLLIKGELYFSEKTLRKSVLSEKKYDSPHIIGKNASLTSFILKKLENQLGFIHYLLQYSIILKKNGIKSYKYTALITSRIITHIFYCLIKFPIVALRKIIVNIVER